MVVVFASVMMGGAQSLDERLVGTEEVEEFTTQTHDDRGSKSRGTEKSSPGKRRDPGRLYSLSNTPGRTQYHGRHLV